MTRRFQDRVEAGAKLASALWRYRENANAIVLALPRGGVPVAYVVSEALKLPLDIFVVRKLGAPGHEELAIGAIATGGVLILNKEVIAHLKIPPRYIETIQAAETIELERREKEYRGERPPLDVRGKEVILVDDGVATGASMKAAIEGLKKLGAKKIVAAIPVSARETSEELEKLADEFEVILEPDPFYNVGRWYEDFSEVSDEEVCEFLIKQ